MFRHVLPDSEQNVPCSEPLDKYWQNISQADGASLKSLHHQALGTPNGSEHHIVRKSTWGRSSTRPDGEKKKVEILQNRRTRLI